MQTLKSFVPEMDALGREEFVRRYPHPFLLGQSTSAPASSRAFKTMAGFTPQQDESAGEGEQPVHFVTKSDRNTFGTMITLGRIDNNDVVIDHPSVSKFHAYFTAGSRGDRWSVCDAESRYGTFSNDRRLRPSAPQPVESGQTLAFGKGPKFSFYTPGDFFDYVQILKGLGKV
jgi:hypothetical protein